MNQTLNITYNNSDENLKIVSSKINDLYIQKTLFNSISALLNKDITENDRKIAHISDESAFTKTVSEIFSQK